MENVICEKIKLQSKAKGVSVKKMLGDLEINPGFLTDINRRNVYPAADKLHKIADYLGCSVDYLLGRTDNPEVNK